MRYIKHIYEMEEWATSNRLSSLGCQELSENTIKHSLEMKIPINVMIKKTSKYYRDNQPHNPNGVIGKITKFSPGSLPILVEWSNGLSAVYDFCDLEIVE